VTAARQFAALCAAAIALAAAFLALDRGVQHGQSGAQAVQVSSADARAVSAAHQPPTSPEPAAQSAAGAPNPGDTGMDVGDILEPMAAQLADLLAQLRDQCAAARRTADVPVPSAATRCVEAGEATANTVEFVRGTLASAAGRDVPGSVRARWTRDLDDAGAEIRTSLTPWQESLGRALASGGPSPAAFRDIAHLRDRIARVLAELNEP
jgi:hypothetical protein